jgi:hypothetical protein
MHYLNRVKKSPKHLGKFQTIAQSKQSPNERKFAQSCHTVSNETS